MTTQVYKPHRFDPHPGLAADAKLAVAVIIAAYRAEKWIGQCIESVRAQRLPPGVQVELRIGVDACPLTAAALDRLGVQYWTASDNVGPYVVRNSLIALAPADAYAVFDADDLMLPKYLTTLLRAAGSTTIAGGARFTIDATGKRLDFGRTKPYQHGVAVFPQPVWEKLGGYLPWRFAADTELTFRARHFGIPLTKMGIGLYERRKHGSSLTQLEASRMGSPARRAAADEGRSAVISGRTPLKIEPVTVPLEFHAERASA